MRFVSIKHDLTPAEQNSLDNWIMLVAQTLCTNVSQQQVLNNRTNQVTVANIHIINDNNLNISSDEQIKKGDKVNGKRN